MGYPSFFSQVPRIRMQDPLAELLGAAREGILEYTYEDAVALAGHSCPTVAGAWVLCSRALARLYPMGLPQRGGIRVAMRDALQSGTTGVVASVIGLVTGAAGEGGFKGLGGRFARCGLLSFGNPIAGEVRFTRVDTGDAVEACFHPDVVPPEPALRALLERLLEGSASPAERAEFGRLWQLRVKRILIDHWDDPALVTLTTVRADPE